MDMERNPGSAGYAIVTGASSGLGKRFALELASRGIDTILISLPGEGIMDVCASCRAKGTDSVFYEIDLTDMKQLKDTAADINRRYRVRILINNAGIGGSNIFEKASAGYVDAIIRLNVGATTMMTHEILPNLLDNSRAFILNISSLASLTPTGFKTVYPASKCFVRYFSTGLRYELKDTPVSVSVALLGPMPTRPEISERIKSQGLTGRFLTITPESAAKECLDKMFKGKGTIVAGWTNKVSHFLLKFIPEDLRASVMTRRMCNELRCQGLV